MSIGIVITLLLWILSVTIIVAWKPDIVTGVIHAIALISLVNCVLQQL